jgi:isoprenylcysteine carboxyl methyltransferase (ICMT) family protein YpbQ
VTTFFEATVRGRSWIFLSSLGLVMVGMSKPPLVLFGVVDLLGALWTWRAMKKRNR